MTVRKRLAAGGRGKPIYYWCPSKRLRDQGWPIIRLSDQREQALLEAEKHNAELDRWYSKGLPTPGPKPGTVSALVRRYRADEAFSNLAQRTKRDYLQHLDLIEEWAGDKPVKAITRRAVQAYRRGMADKPWRANAILRTLRIVLQFAVDEGELRENPATRFRQFRTPPRQQIWSIEDEERFLAAAQTLARPSMVLAYALGIYTAQRGCDIVCLSWTAYNGETIRLRQSKTDKWVEIPVAPALKALVEATPRVSTQILVSEATEKPYSEDHFRHTFARIMAKAGLKDLRFQDLRRTAVVRLAEMGATTARITAITGHSDAEGNRIIETYMPRTRRMAEDAVKLMVRYYERKR